MFGVTIPTATMLGLLFVANTAAQATLPTTAKTIAPALREEIDRLMSDDAGKRASAAMALSEYEGDVTAAIPYLMAILGDTKQVFGPVLGQTTVRGVAVYALGKIGRPAIAPLIASLNAKASDLRQGAAWALGELKVQEAVGPLIEHLSRETEGNALGAAAHALAAIGDKRAVPALISALDRPIGPQDDFPWELSESLASFKDPAAIGPLIALAERALAAGNYTAHQVLRAAAELARQNFHGDVKAARAWWEQNKPK